MLLESNPIPRYWNNQFLPYIKEYDFILLLVKREKI
jgi:hypothetical protein